MSVRNMVEDGAVALAYLYFLVSVAMFVSYNTPATAAVDTMSRGEIIQRGTGGSAVDSIARGEILHLKELQEADRRFNDQRFRAQESAVSTALTALEKATAQQAVAAKEAVTKVEMATEKRFDSVNEFRGQLKDQAATFITRAELWGTVSTGMMVLIALIGIYQKWASKTKPEKEQT